MQLRPAIFSALTALGMFGMAQSADAQSAEPQIVAIAATPSGDGILHIRTGVSNPAGAFALSTYNAGGAGYVKVQADTGSEKIGVTTTVCETNAQAQCVTSNIGSVTLPIAKGGEPTFSVFVSIPQYTCLPDDPSTYRVYVRFWDGSSQVGVTSVGLEACYPQK